MKNSCKKIAESIEHATIAMSIAFTICTIFYFVVAVWWTSIVEANHKEEMEKFRSCYQEWRYNEAHKESWLHINYCGEVGLSDVSLSRSEATHFLAHQS